MIEKFDDQNGFCMADCMNKINEVIDTVNNIQKEREAEWFEIREWIDILEAVRKSVNVHEKQIDELQMKVEPEKCESHSENVQKEPITLLDVFNEMGEMYSSLWNKMEDIHHDLKTKGGDNDIPAN